MTISIILTPLAKKLRAIRQRAIANGLQLQSVESIVDEVEQSRREASNVSRHQVPPGKT
jgi:hypothetical protein